MYDRITLPNGVRIVAEHVPGHAFGAIGIWIMNGSRP